MPREAQMLDVAGAIYGNHPIVHGASGTHALYPVACDSRSCPNPDISLPGLEGSHDGSEPWFHNGRIWANPAGGCDACVAPIEAEPFNTDWDLPWGWPGPNESGADGLGDAPLSPAGQLERYSDPGAFKEMGLPWDD
jgi:hypothetical protein